MYLMMNFLQKDDEESIMDMNRQNTLSKKTKRKIERDDKIISQYPMLKEDHDTHSMADSMLQTKEEVHQ